MTEVHHFEEEQAEIARQEALRQQEMEQRLAQAQPAGDEAAQAMASGARSEQDAMRVQLVERTTVTNVETRITQITRETAVAVDKPQLQRHDAARATDVQVQQAGDALRGMPEFRPENWQRLSDGQRLEACQQAENRMAAIQGRPAVEVVSEQLKPGTYGEYRFGDRRIHLSQDHLRSNDSREVLDTMAHEGRHAYQHYAMEHPGFHSNQAEVNAWIENSNDYLDPRLVSPEDYINQPVEADAFGYADRVVSNAMGGRR